MRREADAMRACRRAGLRVPDVLADDDGTFLGTTGLVMRRVPGETIARSHPAATTSSPSRGRCWWTTSRRFLAGLHAIDPAEVPGVEAPDPVEPIWQKYLRIDDRSATFEQVHAWLVAHRPPHSADALIHGDLRMGNVIVGPTGLEAVIDWELVHRGDPLEDLAWLSLKAWRFGEPLEVGGLGTLDELVGAYEAAGGRRVDRAALHWWLVAKTLTWGIGCMLQADVPPVRARALGGAGDRRPARRRAGVGPHRAPRPRSMPRRDGGTVADGAPGRPRPRTGGRPRAS